MTKKKSPSKEAPPVVDQILELVGSLSKEERAKMQEAGIVMPLATSAGLEKVYGYRCAHCNSVAIHFIGRSFHAPGGEILDGPPIGLRPVDTSWTPAKEHKMSSERIAPTCHRCQGVLYLPGGRWHKKMMVTVEEWESARDRAYEKIRKKRRSPRDLAAMPPEAAHVDLSDGEATRMPKDIVDPGERQAFSQLSDDIGLASQLMPK